MKGLVSSLNGVFCFVLFRFFFFFFYFFLFHFWILKFMSINERK
uniref:Uncharacterized protein n=1 Tax=Anguilla anguilla TaxID=7936 RepID=A0A0E9WN76_ANGAN